MSPQLNADSRRKSSLKSSSGHIDTRGIHTHLSKVWGVSSQSTALPHGKGST